MPLYFYSDADTFVHRLHPVTKILGALLLFVPALASSRAELLGALVLGVLCLAAWSRVGVDGASTIRPSPASGGKILRGEEAGR